MRKVINCKPVPELEINIDGGDSVLLRFDVNAVMALQELEGGIAEVLKMKIPEMAATIIYAGAITSTPDFTIEKARQMVAFMAIEDITAIIDEFSNSMGVVKNGESEEYAKKLMAQFLMGLK